MTNPTAIAAESLELAFRGQAAIRDVSFSVPRGRFLSLVGPSGCGKTSLLRMVAGLQQPSSGTLAVHRQNGHARPRVGFVFQDPNLLPWRDVVANIRLPLELDRQPGLGSQEAVNRALNMVGLHDEDRRKLPRMLSGGMRMRVSLARAIVQRPEILLLDEPFAALDDLLRQRLNEELLALWQQEKWTVMFVTHNVSEAVFLSQEVLVLSERPGKISARIKIPFEYPRGPSLRSRPDYAELTGKVSQLLRGATQ